VVVVADGSKLGRVMLARMADLNLVDELITDSSADPRHLDALRASGTRITVAPLTQG
jgi:DeoR family transcriptional regulator of aga operon